MEDKRKWEEAPLNEATDWELSCFLDSLDTGMSRPHYELGIVSRVIQERYISKSCLEGIYFWDILNVCETYEEVKEYIEDLIKGWR